MWVTLDMKDNDQLLKLTKFLQSNYKNNELFSINYYSELVKWFLTPKIPGTKFYAIGMENEKGELIGFISSSIVNLLIDNKAIQCGCVNFLCVHLDHRNKGITPLLVSKLMEQDPNVSLTQGTVFSGSGLPFNPTVKTTYYYRYLNVKKLVNNQFINSTNLSKRKIKMMERLYNNVRCNKINIRKMIESDLPAMYSIFNTNKNKYRVTYNYQDLDEFSKYFSNEDNTIYTYVVENDDNITDWISFYSLPYLVSNTREKIWTAHLLRLEITQTSVVDMMKNIFNICQQLDFDIFLTLNLFDINKHIKDLKLNTDDVNVDFYNYNYDIENISPEEWGVVIP